MLWCVWRQALCRDLGLEEAAIPTPAALWRLLHRGRAMPRGATWADLQRDADAGQLRAAAAHRSAEAGGGVASWNVRWLTDPGTDKAVLVRKILEAHVEQGIPMLLQETHWGDAAAAGSSPPG